MQNRVIGKWLWWGGELLLNYLVRAGLFKVETFEVRPE